MMLEALLSRCSLPEEILQPLFVASDSSTLENALEVLIAVSRTSDGRSDLASKDILPVVLLLCQNLSNSCAFDLLLLSLKLLRNLCAGELAHQNLFVEKNGVGILLTIFDSGGGISVLPYGMIRMGLQVIANVSLAGEVHQRAIWPHFFPLKFLEIAKVRKREVSDPLCMVVYTCCDGSQRLLAELYGDQGLPIVAEIVRTASEVGFGEDWLKLLLSRICLEEAQFPQLLSELCLTGASENCQYFSKLGEGIFVSEQAFLLSMLSEILNERMGAMSISSDFALCILRTLKQVVGLIDFTSGAKSGLPTGLVDVDILGYSLTILRDICAHDGLEGSNGSAEAMDSVLSSNLLELLLQLLGEVEPPEIIKKTMKQGENPDGSASSSSKLCPYRGFRRDIVAVIGNCAYQRKHVQDEIRKRKGILLLLQQCVTDDDNPFLREWGIWTVRNLLEGNVENQLLVTELELQGSVDVPEISRLGLRVEVDQKTRRPKLVNVP